VSAVLDITDKTGAEVVLTEADIARIDAKRNDDIGRYCEQIRQTLEDPDYLWEGRHKDTKAFYRKGLLPEDSPFRGCFVCVMVRYSDIRASVRTVYFPFNMNAKLGNLLYISPRVGGSR